MYTGPSREGKFNQKKFNMFRRGLGNEQAVESTQWIKINELIA